LRFVVSLFILVAQVAMKLSAAQLRQEISARNVARGADYEHELSWGAAPSVIYQEAKDGGHGNFYRLPMHGSWRIPNGAGA
jgi:hypothetical protein